MVEKKTKFCRHCGKKIDAKAEICPKCGIRVKKPPQVAYKRNPGIPAVLSFLWSGLGQIHNGQIGKGIILAILSIFFALLSLILIGIPFVIVILFYAIYDAYTTAKKINSGEIKT